MHALLLIYSGSLVLLANSCNAVSSSAEMLLARQAKYMRAKPEIMMASNLHTPSIASWFSNSNTNDKDSTANFSGTTVDGSQANRQISQKDIELVNQLSQGIDDKLARLANIKSILLQAATQIIEKPAEARKPTGVLKSYLAFPTYMCQSGEESQRINKYISSLADSQVLFDITKALLTDFNHIVPSESEVSIYEHLLFRKAHLIQSILAIVEDFPVELYGTSRKQTLFQIINVNENGNEEREVVIGMLRNYSEDVKAQHVTELSSLRRKIHERADKIRALQEQSESIRKNGQTLPADILQALEAASKAIDIANQSYIVGSITKCHELLDKIKSFEAEHFQFLEEFIARNKSTIAAGTAKEGLILDVVADDMLKNFGKRNETDQFNESFPIGSYNAEDPKQVLDFLKSNSKKRYMLPNYSRLMQMKIADDEIMNLNAETLGAYQQVEDANVAKKDIGILSAENAQAADKQKCADIDFDDCENDIDLHLGAFNNLRKSITSQTYDSDTQRYLGRRESKFVGLEQVPKARENENAAENLSQQNAVNEPLGTV